MTLGHGPEPATSHLSVDHINRLMTLVVYQFWCFDDDIIQASDLSIYELSNDTYNLPSVFGAVILTQSRSFELQKRLFPKIFIQKMMREKCINTSEKDQRAAKWDYIDSLLEKMPSPCETQLRTSPSFVAQRDRAPQWRNDIGKNGNCEPKERRRMLWTHLVFLSFGVHAEREIARGPMPDNNRLVQC